jgi:hypothetical protein
MSTLARRWELAPAVIDYVAGRLGIDRRQACDALKDALRDGLIRARGPIAGANASEVSSNSGASPKSIPMVGRSISRRRCKNCHGSKSTPMTF